MEGPLRYPFEIFPKGIWEKIILEVKDCGDLQNLMKASKQLNDTFMGISHLWLLDKVLPLLTTRCKKYDLTIRDMKKLRLVDKRWCGAVNTFLENRPILRPYNKNDVKVNSEKHIWDSSWWTKLGDIDGSCCRNGKYNAIGTVSFEHLIDSYYRAVKKFVANFKNSKSNPFLTRYIEGEAMSRGKNDLLPGGGFPFWWKMKNTVFKMSGKHVWFLTMSWNIQDYDEVADYIWSAVEHKQLWRDIVISLSSLPNLKSLNVNLQHLWIYGSDSAAQNFLQSEENQLPSLPFLESLNIPYEYNPSFKLFYQQLLSKYSFQLRRLQINIVHWENGETWTFPNLTELCLEDIYKSSKVTQVLESLEALQLAKLKIKGGRGMSKYNLKMEEDIFTWLTLFPSLLHLDISNENFTFSESGALNPQRDSKPSLKYLKIQNWLGVTYNFLRCLPNLQRLQICLNEEPKVWDCSAYSELEIRIKLELETCSLYQSNVWELCPRLRTISLCYRGYQDWKLDRHHDEFDRETYEKLKNNPNSGLGESAELRPDIVDFLRRNEASCRAAPPRPNDGYNRSFRDILLGKGGL